MTRISACDPGLQGALALIDTDCWSLEILDMPLEVGRADRNAVSPSGVAAVLRKFRPDHVFVEDVWSRPGEGAVGAFSFGCSLGIVLGAAAVSARLVKVRPQEWKAKTGTPANKDEARERATVLFPNHADLFKRKKDDGRAESAILCLYGVLTLGLKPTKPMSRNQELKK